MKHLRASEGKSMASSMFHLSGQSFTAAGMKSAALAPWCPCLLVWRTKLRGLHSHQGEWEWALERSSSYWTDYPKSSLLCEGSPTDTVVPTLWFPSSTCLYMGITVMRGYWGTLSGQKPGMVDSGHPDRTWEEVPVVERGRCPKAHKSRMVNTAERAGRETQARTARVRLFSGVWVAAVPCGDWGRISWDVVSPLCSCQWRALPEAHSVSTKNPKSLSFSVSLCALPSLSPHFLSLALFSLSPPSLPPSFPPSLPSSLCHSHSFSEFILLFSFMVNPVNPNYSGCFPQTPVPDDVSRF